MSVLIKGMDMPACCNECPILQTGSLEHYCPLAQDVMEGSDIVSARSKDCPLVEVPTPHGDLIDRDYLLNSEKVLFNDTVINHWAVINAPTIIETEE